MKDLLRKLLGRNGWFVIRKNNETRIKSKFYSHYNELC